MTASTNIRAMYTLQGAPRRHVDRLLEVARYVSVGLLTYVIDISVYLLVVAIDARLYLAANAAGRIVGAIVGFFLHRSWTFKTEDRPALLTQAWQYLGLLLISMALSSAVLVALVDLMKLPPAWARVATDVIVIGVVYLASRFIFRPRRSTAPR